MNLTYAETDRVYRHLREVKDSLGPKANMHDRAIVLIAACISNGCDTRHQIIKRLRVTGLSVNYVIGTLDDQTGDIAGLHLWRCDDGGRYHLLDAG